MLRRIREAGYLAEYEQVSGADILCLPRRRLLDCGRRSENVIYGHDLDGTEIERLDARLDRRAIAGNDDSEFGGENVLLRDALDFSCSDGFDLLHVGREVIVRQAVHERLLEPRR